MTVYELMQELSRYKADTEVKFNVKAEYDTDVKAEFDRENEDDIQEVTVTALFDDTVYFADIEGNESVRYGNSYIQINLEY